jgi:hypothetical protein
VADAEDELEGQPVDEPLADDEADEVADHADGTWGGKASTEDDGVPSFDEEDSEEVEDTLPEDSYDQGQAEPDGEGPQ